MIQMQSPRDDDRPVGAEDLATRVRVAMKSPHLSKEEKADISRMWGFARVLDAAVLVALEDAGY